MGVLGIDIGGTNIRVGYIDNNDLVRVESAEIINHNDELSVVNQIKLLIKKFVGNSIAGIGIGVPSVVDVEKGIVYDVQNIPSWKEVHLKEILEREFKIPVYINNDANCFAAGEKYFGKGKGYKDVVGLICGTGLGAGLIVNNRLYSGSNCGAGEFGMIHFKDQNYEYYCCGQFFKNKYGVSGEELACKATAGDKKSLEIFEEFGENLGEALKMIMFAVDPEIIIIGGSVSKSFPFYEKQMWKSIQSFAYSKSVSRIKIEISEMEHVAILGAAALYFDAKSV
jgi:glucokinase